MGWSPCRIQASGGPIGDRDTSLHPRPSGMVACDDVVRDRTGWVLPDRGLLLTLNELEDAGDNMTWNFERFPLGDRGDVVEVL